jgi:hypothetical protein
MYVGERLMYIDCLVSESVDEILLSSEFLIDNNVQWDLAEALIVINGKEIRLRPRTSDIDAVVRRVYVCDNIKFEPNTIANIPVQMKLTRWHTPSCDWVLEPRVQSNSLYVPRILLARGAEATIRVLNVSDRPVLLRNGFAIGNCGALTDTADVISDPSLIDVSKILSGCLDRPRVFGGNEQDVSYGPNDIGKVVIGAAVRAPSGDANSVQTPPTDKGANFRQTNAAVNAIKAVRAATNNSDIVQSSADDYKLIQPMIDTLPKCITENDRERIEQILLKNVNILARHDYDCGETNLIECDLHLKDPNMQAIAQPLRRHAISQLPIIDAEVKRMVDAGILSRNPFPTRASNVVLVQKHPVGNGPPK